MSISVSVGEGLPADVGALTEDLFREAAEDLAKVIHRVKSGDFAAAKAVPGALGNLRAAFHIVQEERGRFEKRCKQLAGSVGAGALDLHAARDEIGSRLARLRDAGPG